MILYFIYVKCSKILNCIIGITLYTYMGIALLLSLTIILSFRKSHLIYRKSHIIYSFRKSHSIYTLYKSYPFYEQIKYSYILHPENRSNT